MPDSYTVDMSGWVNSPTGLDATGSGAPCPLAPETYNVGVVTLVRTGPCMFRYDGPDFYLELDINGLLYLRDTNGCDYGWNLENFTCCGGGGTSWGTTISGMYGVGTVVPTPAIVPAGPGSCPPRSSSSSVSSSSVGGPTEPGPDCQSAMLLSGGAASWMGPLGDGPWWFKWVCPTSGPCRATFTATGHTPSCFVYTGACPDALEQIAGVGSCTDFTGVEGQTYYLGLFLNGSNNVVLSIGTGACAPP